MCFYRSLPVRADREFQPQNFMKLGWFRSSHTPSLSESFEDVGSRSKGLGEKGEKAHRGDAGGGVPAAPVSTTRLLRGSLVLGRKPTGCGAS
jgi:hypothetical protein